MRQPFFASVVALAGSLALAGCMPMNFLDAGSGGSGGSPGGLGGGFGGAGAYATTTQTGTTAIGGAGGAGGDPSPFDLGYLCGGSLATCSPDPGGTDCTPGGPGNLGGAAPDAGAKLSCQLVAVGSAVQTTCALAGDSAADGPCTQASDCAAGQGCGLVGATGVCHAYCCSDPESCPAATVCTATPMAEASALPVPLCLPAVNCELLSDTPTCPAGQTCAIVRNDGTRSCTPIGPGITDQACPCAAGYTCSPATHTCRKLCHTSASANTPGECGPGTCQGGTAQYPAGIGICVGGE